jgi:hypothetical protein
MKPVRNSLLACFLALFAVPACGDDEHEVPPECEEIAELCHDSTTDEGQECHENAEEVWSAAECTANEAACLAECAPEE